MMSSNNNNNNSNASSSSSSSGGGRGAAAPTSKKKWGFAASAGTAWKNMVDKTYQSSRDLMDKTKVASNKMAESTKLSTQKMAQSTQKMAEATKQSTQKMAEATKQSSQRFAELSKRNSEKLLQKVKFDTQRLQQQQQQEQEMDGTTPITSNSTSTTSNRGVNRSSIMMMGNTLNWIPNVNGNKNKQAPDVLADTMEEALEKFMTLMDNEHEVHIKWELQMTPFFIKDNTDHQDIYKAFLNWGREERLTTAAQEMANRVSQSMASSNSGSGGIMQNNNNNNIGSSGEMEITFVPQEGELPAPGMASTDTESTASSSTTTSTNNKDSTATTTTATGTTFTENGTETTEIVYNVTKALKRFEVYATWMEDHRADLTDLSAESLTDAARAWNLKLQLDLQGRLVWYVDVATMDIDKILHKDSMTLEESTSHSISLRDSLRWIVFMSHIMMLDESAQEHGMVVVLSMGDKTMVESVGLLPKMERLAKKLDKFTIGKLPVKLKTVYILPGVGKQGRWVSVVTGLLKAFLSDVMRRRICVVDNVIKGTPVSAETYLFDKLGKEKVPIGFGGLDGSCPQDIIFGRFITSAESEKAILEAALEGDVVAEEEEQQEDGVGATTVAAASADGDADAPTPALTKEEAANDTFVIE